MNGRELVDCLEFDNQLALDEQVQLSFPDPASLVVDPDRWLRDEGNPTQRQLSTQRALVDRLQVARTQLPVDFDGGADDSEREAIELRILNQKDLRVLRVFAVHQGHVGPDARLLRRQAATPARSAIALSPRRLWRQRRRWARILCFLV